LKKIYKIFLLQQIRVIVKDIEKSARNILMIMQNIHNGANGTTDENISMFLGINSSLYYLL